MDYTAMRARLAIKAVELDPREIPDYGPDGSELKTVEAIAAAMGITRTEAELRIELEVKSARTRIARVANFWRGPNGRYIEPGQVIPPGSKKDPKPTRKAPAPKAAAKKAAKGAKKAAPAKKVTKPAAKPKPPAKTAAAKKAAGKSPSRTTAAGKEAAKRKRFTTDRRHIDPEKYWQDRGSGKRTDPSGLYELTDNGDGTYSLKGPTGSGSVHSIEDATSMAETAREHYESNYGDYRTALAERIASQPGRLAPVDLHTSGYHERLADIYDGHVERAHTLGFSDEEIEALSGTDNDKARAVLDKYGDSPIRARTAEKIYHSAKEQRKQHHAYQYAVHDAKGHDHEWEGATWQDADRRVRKELTPEERAEYEPGKWKVAKAADDPEAVKAASAQAYISRMGAYYGDIGNRDETFDEKTWMAEARRLGEEDAERWGEAVTIYSNGPHKVIAAEGVKLTPAQRKNLFAILDDLIVATDPHEQVVITVVPSGQMGALGMVSSSSGRKTMQLSADLLTPENMRPGFRGKYDTGEWGSGKKFEMPVRDKASKLRYVMTHEWGHMLDYRLHPEDQVAKDDGREYDVHHDPLRETDDLFREASDGLSLYASRNTFEAYAEAFVEWFLSGGGEHSDNPVVMAYARRYGWRMRRRTDGEG